MGPMGLMPARFGPREGTAPTRGPEAKAPLATAAAPVALQQSRILQTSPQRHLPWLDCQSFAAASLENPVLNRRCPVLNRHCPVLFRPRQQLEKLSNEALSYSNNIPKHLENAEKFLDVAKVDYEDGALSPFWDNIEAAICEVGHANECINNIEYVMRKHSSVKKEAKFDSATFPLNPSFVSELAVASATTDRLNKIVRAAQCSPDFAKIYETKRQTQILIAGFSGLGLALRGISNQIESSINVLGDRIDGKMNDLSENIQSSISQLSVSNHEDSQILKDSIEKFHNDYSKSSKKRSIQVEEIKNKLSNLSSRPRNLLTKSERKNSFLVNEWVETTVLTDSGDEIKGVGHDSYEAYKNAASVIRRKNRDDS